MSTLAGKALAEGGLSAVLLAKTGSIVAEYKREFYLPPVDPHQQPRGCHHRLHTQVLA